MQRHSVAVTQIPHFPGTFQFTKIPLPVPILISCWEKEPSQCEAEVGFFPPPAVRILV